ncbi:phage tail protein [Veillonella caviae]|uniref:phage tail-collar fiber domain-containing protein n=1 Tax=Veillonella caviae TaxID=248316 RepID=UPI000F8D94C2|nr:phage tail protein [Veillonella caviae]
MANWSGFVLTDVGAKLQAKINAGLTTLKFTKLGIGSGSGSGSINALTAMVNKVQDINIGSVKANNNIVTINSTLTNKGLGSAYQMRELGLFATDPDVGEILFAYMTDNTPDTMPADGSATVVSQDITLNITFSNTGKVSATIDTGAFVTHEDLNTHNTSSSAHADIRQLFKNYLPLTGGTLTGRLYVNDAVFMGTETSQYGNFIERSKAGTMYLASGKSESSNLSWFNVDGYFKYTDTAEMCVIKRDENSNILARAFLLDQDNKTRFPNEVYANEKLLATKEYVDGKKWGATSITDGAVTPNKLDRPYLPLTGGAVTGKLHVNDLVSTGNDSMQFSNFIQTSMAGKAYLATGKGASESWFNIDGYFNNPEQSNISAIKRNADGDIIARAFLLHADNKTYFPNEVYSNEKLLATKEYVDTKGTNDLNAHNTSSSAHSDIRTKITNDINTHNSSNSAHTDIRQMFNNYLPLTGGTVTGRLHVNDLVSTGNDTMQFSNFIQTSMAGKAYFATGKSASESWCNLDAYFNDHNNGTISAIKRDSSGNIVARAYLLDKDNKTRFFGEVYSNGKLLATKEYVDTKGINDLNAHNSSSSAHNDIRNQFKSYLPLTGGTLTGGLSITYGSGNPVHSIKSGGGSTFRNLDVGSAQNTTKVALSCLERPIWYNDTVGANDLALLKDLDWKKLYSVNRAAFVMPTSGTALCDIPSNWKELHITWIWTSDTYTINNVVGHKSYTANIINGAIADPIIFVFPDSEGALVVKNNKLYVIDRGQSADGVPVLVMWR